jgi:hypothetical protein
MYASCHPVFGQTYRKTDGCQSKKGTNENWNNVHLLYIHTSSCCDQRVNLGYRLLLFCKHTYLCCIKKWTQIINSGSIIFEWIWHRQRLCNNFHNWECTYQCVSLYLLSQMTALWTFRFFTIIYFSNISLITNVIHF